MKKILFWVVALFSRKTKVIESQKIQITSTGTFPVTEEVREKYLKELKSCMDSRIKEYPTWEEVLEALVDAECGDSSKLNVVKRRRLLVKQKYQKPMLKI